MAVKHTSHITIKVGLDENKIPEMLRWSAEDGGIDDEETKSVMLSVWDHRNKEALRIDLWTKEMPVDDMKIFFYHTLRAMADTFERATGDEKMSATMRDFTDYYAEKMELDKFLGNQ